MKRIFTSVFLLFIGIALSEYVNAQTATVKIDAGTKYQKITGFGGFVCAPTFNYGHMSTTEIKKLWGKDSETGYNIMRLYIPIGESAWSQSLTTAKLAQSLGLIIFASPWSMPAMWKTNNNIAGVYTDGDGVEHEGFLKEENYEDYANYLNGYVTYLRDNGVELAGISLQNEPDIKVGYAGCSWTPDQIVSFIKNYGNLIDCKIIAPESVGISNSYITPLIQDDVIDKYDIYAGHQYAGIQGGVQQVYEKGKEIWMTEYLINWNEGGTTRDYNWQLDAFDFAGKLNDAMLSNVSAWVHYAAKRYYGMIGDGTNGTTLGVITKRGYILSHYAKYSTGATRVNAVWNDDLNVLEGSSYLSVTGDSVIVQVINPSGNACELTLDLPFYTNYGTSIVTTETLSMSGLEMSIAEETFRPKVNISPSSVTTLIFGKSSERPESQMEGQAIHYNLIDSMKATALAFGTAYRLSGQSVTFDHNDGNMLISSNKSNGNGYLQLNDRYTRLVFHVETVSSANQYNSDNTTLYYVNGNGLVKSHNYGKIDLPQTGNFDWILNISRDVLTDGCIGVLGISNSNYSSVLTIKFGDVYFLLGNEKAGIFSGIYSKSDSYLIDCLDDVNYTSLDFTEVSGITPDEDWNTTAANENCIYYVGSDVTNTSTNVIAGTTCSELTLSDQGGGFYVPYGFTATAASYSRTFEGYGIMVLPFEAGIPAGAKAYTLQPSGTEITCTLITDNIIPSNTPVLIVGTGTFTFEGTGEVSTPKALTVNDMNGVYIATKAPAGSYSLQTVGGITAFYRVTAGSEPVISPFSAYLKEDNGFSVTSIPLRLSDSNSKEEIYQSVRSIKLFPNPAKDVLNMECNLSGARYAVFDIRGTQILENTLVSGTTQIDISNLSEGVYFIKVTGSERTEMDRFIKE